MEKEKWMSEEEHKKEERDFLNISSRILELHVHTKSMIRVSLQMHLLFPTAGGLCGDCVYC